MLAPILSFALATNKLSVGGVFPLGIFLIDMQFNCGKEVLTLARQQNLPDVNISCHKARIV